jgi:hypothetical protein
MLHIERRLEQLAHDIVHFEFLETALMVGFPDFKPPSERNWILVRSWPA